MGKELQTNEWYQHLIDNCKAIITEAVFTSRWALVEGYWKLGEEIRTDKKAQEYAKGNKTFVQDLGRNLGISSSTIYYALQAYDKFPELNQIPDGKNITWNKLITKYLPEPKKEKTPDLPEGKYQVIYADPAWQYWEGGEKNQSRHYKTMEFEEIANLPVQQLQDDNCILFLWATRPILPQAIELIERWGFKYSTVGFVWVKSKQDGTGFAFGNGNWTRANAEYCLIGTKGSIERKDATISEIIYEPREEHSKKPDIIKEKIVQLVGNLPRIELFARRKTKGWTVWGNEI